MLQSFGPFCHAETPICNLQGTNVVLLLWNVSLDTRLQISVSFVFEAGSYLVQTGVFVQ